MDKKALRSRKNYEVKSGTFNNKICSACAYKCKGICTINNTNISFLRECPDGYTVELCGALQRDTVFASLTGKHSNVYYNWKPNFPDAPYPKKDRSYDDEEEYDFA